MVKSKERILEFSVPSDLKFENIEYFFQKIVLPKIEVEPFDYILFNIDELITKRGLIEPFGVMRLKNYLVQLNKKGIKLRRNNTEITSVNNTYAKTMRIFGLFNLDDKTFGEHYTKPFEKENTMHYPLHEIDLSNLKKESLYTQGKIDDLSNRLARIITSETKDSDFFLYISFSINEIIRNIVHHSESSELLVMAQKWKEKRRCLELSIMDLGNGIDSTLGKLSKQLDNQNITPLKLSLIPGASSKLTTYFNDDAENSGFGLYMISELIKDYGEFFILSGNEGICLKKNQKKHFETNTLGTIISIRIDLDAFESYDNKMSKLRGEGLEIREYFEEEKNRSILVPFAEIDWKNLFDYEDY